MLEEETIFYRVTSVLQNSQKHIIAFFERKSLDSQCNLRDAFGDFWRLLLGAYSAVQFSVNGLSIT
jgi:hypothetical protein